MHTSCATTFSARSEHNASFQTQCLAKCRFHRCRRKQVSPRSAHTRQRVPHIAARRVTHDNDAWRHRKRAVDDHGVRLARAETPQLFLHSIVCVQVPRERGERGCETVIEKVSHRRTTRSERQQTSAHVTADDCGDRRAEHYASVFWWEQSVNKGLQVIVQQRAEQACIVIGHLVVPQRRVENNNGVIVDELCGPGAVPRSSKLAEL